MLTLHTDRCAAVGAAAAHDLNEDLTVILSATILALKGLPVGHPVREHLLHVQSAAQRCAAKAAGLLNFSRTKGALPTSATLEEQISGERAAKGKRC